MCPAKPAVAGTGSPTLGFPRHHKTLEHYTIVLTLKLARIKWRLDWQVIDFLVSGGSEMLRVESELICRIGLN